MMMMMMTMITIVMICVDHINSNLTVFCRSYINLFTFDWLSFARTCRHCHAITCKLLKTMYLYGINLPVCLFSGHIHRISFSDGHGVVYDNSSTVLLGYGLPSYANAGGTVVCCVLYFRRFAWNWVMNKLNPWRKISRKLLKLNKDLKKSRSSVRRKG